ncbi:MAG: SGNH/GDSL hydrolase family protein [Pseudomonadota bacterium]
MFKKFVQGSLWLFMGFLTTQAHAQFTQLVVFGDSLSDNGNVFAATGMTTPPPPYFNGVFSNGPVWTDLLAEAWGIPQTNLAYGGGLSGISTTGNGLDPTAGTLSVYGSSPLPGVLSQIQLYASQAGSADAGALYVVFVGGNDFFQLAQDPMVLGAFGASIGLDPFDPAFATNLAGAILNLTLDNVTSTDARLFLGGAVTIPSGAVPMLYNLGARNILVANLPDLSLTPAVAAAEMAAPGTRANFLAVVENYNTLLAARLEILRQNFPDLNLIEYDAATALRAVVADPASFGIENTTDSCIDTACFLNPAIDPNTYIFWDAIHPSGTINAITATQIQAAAEASLAPVVVDDVLVVREGSGSGGPLMLLALLGLLAYRRR